MLAGFGSWWLARITELLPTHWTNTDARPRDGIVVVAERDCNVEVSFRRAGKLVPTTLGVAVRQAGRMPVLVRPSPAVVLVKHHTVPTAPRQQLALLLRHELGRITPFPAESLFWRWDGHMRPDNRARTDVTLTMVPRTALEPALATLQEAGLRPDFIEVGPADHPSVLPAGPVVERGAGAVRVLAYSCAALAVVALLLPVALQELALYRTDNAIAALRPRTEQVEALRRRIAAGAAGHDILSKEMAKTGDVLQTLAMVTRILPDDTYLTDFSLRDRQMTLSGRSASAPRLITALSANKAISNTAFAAPVTRMEGASTDIFSIKAEVTP